MATQSSNAHYSPEYLAQDNGRTLVAISVLFIVLDTVFVTLRFYGQRIIRPPVGLDDFIIPLAWCTHIGLCILGILMVRNAGVGRHLAFVELTDPAKLVTWAKSVYAVECIYLTSVALPKISILLLYLRIFVDRRLRIVTQVLVWVMVVNCIVYILAATLQCIPFEYQWNKHIDGKCFNQRVYYATASAPNIATDVLMLLLPSKTLLGLNVSHARKAGLVFIFLVGSMGIIASCARTAYFSKTDAFVDNTWVSVTLVGWSIGEPGMYLIAACSLRLQPVTAKFAEKVHLKDLYKRLSQKRSNCSGKDNSISLRMRTAADSGFHKMQRAESDRTSLVEGRGGGSMFQPEV